MIFDVNFKISVLYGPGNHPTEIIPLIQTFRYWRALSNDTLRSNFFGDSSHWNLSYNWFLGPVVPPMNPPEGKTLVIDIVKVSQNMQISKDPTENHEFKCQKFVLGS